jgi:hypothetical protein
MRDMEGNGADFVYMKHERRLWEAALQWFARELAGESQNPHP